MNDRELQARLKAIKLALLEDDTALAAARLSELGDLLRAEGREADAKILFEQGAELGSAHCAEALRGPDAVILELAELGLAEGAIRAAGAIADAYRDADRRREALEMYALGADNGCAYCAGELGDMLREMGALEEATSTYRLGLDLGGEHCASRLENLLRERLAGILRCRLVEQVTGPGSCRVEVASLTEATATPEAA